MAFRERQQKVARKSTLGQGQESCAAWRRKNVEASSLLLVPLIALLGQLHFAVKFAIDAQGPIKGAYMQFAAIPLYGLFGVAATWGWKKG
jgi:hypothetical protein